MNKKIAEMSDAEIMAVLEDYDKQGISGVLDVQNELEMPTELLVDLAVALDFVEEAGVASKGDYDWLAKNIETEFARRAGQIPLI
jgi:hypothetical protein